MHHSPLQLERHFFTKVQLDANSNGKPGVANQLNCQVEVGQSSDDTKQWQVVLRLKISSPPKEEACYTGEIHAVGLFHVMNGWPAEKIQLLVSANGAALLYGAIRELLLNLTARGPWPEVLLNSMTFTQPKDQPKSEAGKESTSEASKA